MKKDKIFERRLEISSKFLEMGQALSIEGKNNKDFNVGQIGAIMILLGGIILEEQDIIEFSNLCSMFSAKKILEGMEESSSDMTNFIKNKSESESYDDIIKRINKFMRDNNKDNPKE